MAVPNLTEKLISLGLTHEQASGLSQSLESAIENVVTPIIDFISDNPALFQDNDHALLNKTLLCLVQPQTLTDPSALLVFLNFFKEYNEKANSTRRMALLDIFPHVVGKTINENDLKKYLVFINRYYDKYNEEQKLDWLNYGLPMIAAWGERISFNKRTFDLLLDLCKKLHTLKGEHEDNYKIAHEQALPQVLGFIAANPVVFPEQDAGLLNYILLRFNDEKKPLKAENIVLFLELIKKSGHLFTPIQQTELWRIYEPTINNMPLRNKYLFGQLDPLKYSFEDFKKELINRAKQPELNDEQVLMLQEYDAAPTAEKFTTLSSEDQWENDRSRRINLQALLSRGYIDNAGLLEQFFASYKNRATVLLSSPADEKEKNLLSAQTSVRLLSLAAELQEIYSDNKRTIPTSKIHSPASRTSASMTASPRFQNSPLMKTSKITPVTIQQDFTGGLSGLLTAYKTKTWFISSSREEQATKLAGSLKDKTTYLDVIKTLWEHKQSVIDADKTLNLSTTWFRKNFKHNRKGHSRYYQLLNHMINEVIKTGMENDPQSFHVYLDELRKQVASLRYNLIALLKTLEPATNALIEKLGVDHFNNADTVGINLDSGNITQDDLHQLKQSAQDAKLPGHAMTLVDEFIDAAKLMMSVKLEVTRQQSVVCK